MKYSWMTGSFLVGIFLTACASGPTGEGLDRKLEQEPPILSRQEVRQTSEKWIDSSKSLTLEQKARLTSLRTSIASQEDELRKRSLKLRSLLLKAVLSTEDHSDEVTLLQDKLRSTEHERLSLLFSAIRNANVILGRYPSENDQESEEFYNDMMYEIGPLGYF